MIARRRDLDHFSTILVQVAISYHGLFRWDWRYVKAWETCCKNLTENVELTVAAENLELPDIVISLKC